MATPSSSFPGVPQRQTLLDQHLVITNSKNVEISKTTPNKEVIPNSKTPQAQFKMGERGGDEGCVIKMAGRTPVKKSISKSSTTPKVKQSKKIKTSTGESVATNKQLQMAILKIVESANKTQPPKHSPKQQEDVSPNVSNKGGPPLSSSNNNSTLSIPLMDQNELTHLMTTSTTTLSPNKASSKSKQHRIPKKPKALSSSASRGSVRKPTLCSLPSNRVRMLMKTTPNVLSISQEAITVTSKAAELFISKLIQESLQTYKKETVPAKEITYTHLAQSLKDNPQQMKFLLDFVPMKVKAKDFLETQTNKLSSNTCTNDNN